MPRSAVLCLLIVTITSCTNWRPVVISPRNYIMSRNPESVWVKLDDSSTVVLDRPSVVRDTLTGVLAGEYRHIPLAHVARLRAPEPAVAKTAILASASVLACVGVIYWAASSDNLQP